MTEVVRGEAEPLAGPELVYFWGPVRAHVNRVALEYAQRLNRTPVWVDVPDGGTSPAAGALGEGTPPKIRVYALAPGDDVLPGPSGPPLERPSGPEPPTDLATEVGEHVQFPPAVREALRALSRGSVPRVLILTNLDLLGHVELLAEPVLSRSLLATMKARNIAVIITTQKLLRAPALPMECAFRVDSAPDEPWSSAELYPGVPVSCCTSCSGAPNGDYAECSPKFRSVCPIRVPFGTVGEAATA